MYAKVVEFIRQFGLVLMSEATWEALRDARWDVAALVGLAALLLILIGFGTILWLLVRRLRQYRIPWKPVLLVAGVLLVLGTVVTGFQLGLFESSPTIYHIAPPGMDSKAAMKIYAKCAKEAQEGSLQLSRRDREAYIRSNNSLCLMSEGFTRMTQEEWEDLGSWALWAHPTMTPSDQEKARSECVMAAYDAIGGGRGGLMDPTPSDRWRYVRTCLTGKGFMRRQAKAD